MAAHTCIIQSIPAMTGLDRLCQAMQAHQLTLMWEQQLQASAAHTNIFAGLVKPGRRPGGEEFRLGNAALVSPDWTIPGQSI